MTTKARLLQELESAPEALLEATLQFVLATKATPPVPPESNGSEPNGIQSLLDLLDSMPLSPEEAAALPHDGAENHDHYLYGAPKKPV